METEEEILMHPKCDNCVKGQRALAVSKNLKSIRMISAGKELMEIGQYCFQCIYCKVGKRAAKLYARYPKFRAFDLFQPVKK